MTDDESVVEKLVPRSRTTFQGAQDRALLLTEATAHTRDTENARMPLAIYVKLSVETLLHATKALSGFCGGWLVVVGLAVQGRLIILSSPLCSLSPVFLSSSSLPVSLVASKQQSWAESTDSADRTNSHKKDVHGLWVVKGSHLRILAHLGLVARR